MYLLLFIPEQFTGKAHPTLFGGGGRGGENFLSGFWWWNRNFFPPSGFGSGGEKQNMDQQDLFQNGLSDLDYVGLILTSILYAPSIASFKNRINKIDFTNFLHGRA